MSSFNLSSDTKIKPSSTSHAKYIKKKKTTVNYKIGPEKAGGRNFMLTKHNLSYQSHIQSYFLFGNKVHL